MLFENELRDDKIQELYITKYGLSIILNMIVYGLEKIVMTKHFDGKEDCFRLI